MRHVGFVMSFLFFEKSSFLKFQLQFDMSLLYGNFLSYVKSAMTARLQFDKSFLT